MLLILPEFLEVAVPVAYSHCGVLDIHTYLADVWTSAYSLQFLAQLEILGHLFGLGFFAHLTEPCFLCDKVPEAGLNKTFCFALFTLFCNLSMDTLRLAFKGNMGSRI